MPEYVVEGREICFVGSNDMVQALGNTPFARLRFPVQLFRAEGRKLFVHLFLYGINLLEWFHNPVYVVKLCKCPEEG